MLTLKTYKCLLLCDLQSAMGNVLYLPLDMAILSTGTKKGGGLGDHKGCGSFAHLSQYQPFNTLVGLKGHFSNKPPHTYSSLRFFNTWLNESLSISFIPSFLPLKWRKPASSPYSPYLRPQALISSASQLLQGGWVCTLRGSCLFGLQEESSEEDRAKKWTADLVG